MSEDDVLEQRGSPPLAVRESLDSVGEQGRVAKRELGRLVEDYQLRPEEMADSEEGKPMELNLSTIEFCFFQIWLSPVLCGDVKRVFDRGLAAVWQQRAISHTLRGRWWRSARLPDAPAPLDPSERGSGRAIDQTSAQHPRLLRVHAEVGVRARAAAGRDRPDAATPSGRGGAEGSRRRLSWIASLSCCVILW